MFTFASIAAHLRSLRWMIYDECSKKQKDFKEKLRDGASAPYSDALRADM